MIGARSTFLQANGLCGELVGVLKPVGDAAMEKLETHVQAARIMDIISRIVLKINEVMSQLDGIILFS